MIGQDIAIVPSSSFEDREKNTPISVVADSWILSENFPGKNIIWDARQGILFASDFDSSDADNNTVYTISLTISDSVGMTREISFSFLVLSAEQSDEVTTTDTADESFDKSFVNTNDCSEEEDEDCESEYYEIDCTECDEDSETSTKGSTKSQPKRVRVTNCDPEDTECESQRLGPF